MRATLNIPDELLVDVQTLSGEKSETRAIVTAMEDFVRRRRMDALIALRGKVTIQYDWEAAEQEELHMAEERKSIMADESVFPDTCAWIDTCHALVGIFTSQGDHDTIFRYHRCHTGKAS